MQLRILRHAKSDWGDSRLADRERGLNARGRDDAPRMGRALSQRALPPAVQVSPARRAQLTLAGLAQGWPELKTVEQNTVEELYTFSLHDLLHWIRSRPGGQDLFLIGHNPALTDLVNWCCGARRLDNLPTAGYVELLLQDHSWRELQGGGGEQVFHLFPRDLPRA